MTNILTNSAALKSLYHLQRNEGRATEATERLASGKRLNKAGDDAAGAAIVNRMTSQINGMEVAIRNAGDAISMAQTAEGALNEVSEILQRMRELGVQAANGTYSGADRVALNEEVGALKKELIRISEATQFNTSKLLNGTFQDTEFEIGYDESPQHTHTLSIENIKPTALGIWSSSSQLEKTATGLSVADDGTITTDATHGFVVGDIITYEVPSGSTAVSGLVSGRQYKVVEPIESNQFGLTDIENTPNNDPDDNVITFDGSATHTGVGTKFHLANIAGSPTTTPSNSANSGTTALDSLTNKDETIQVYGYVGDATISYATGATSKDIAEAITAQSGITGVTAYAETNVRLTVSPDSNTSSSTIINFKLTGMNSTAKVVSSTVNFGTIDGKTMADLSDLRDKINGFTGDTGIQAKLSADKQTLDLRSPDGYDIIIDDFDMPMNSASAIVPGATDNVAIDTGSGTSGTFTAASAHGLSVGDAIRCITADGTVQLGGGASTADLMPGDIYYVASVASTTTFTLENDLGTAVTVTTASEDDKLFFEKVEKTLNIQTLDRDLAAKGGPVALHDDTLTGTAEKPNTASSARVSGQIIYQSPNVFTITTPTTLSDSSKALHRDAAPAASLTKISDVNVKTVMGAQRLLSAVDGALRRVDAERGDLGATMNRMEHTIDNLSNIVVNTKISRSRMQDADMAAESIELTKGRILQQAATSMLSQANQSMQSVLELLQ